MEKVTWAIALAAVAVVVVLVGAYMGGVIGSHKADNTPVVTSPNSSSDDATNGAPSVSQTSNESGTTTSNNSTTPKTTDNTTTPKQAVDKETIAERANDIDLIYSGECLFHEGGLASTIDYSVSAEYAPGTVIANESGVFAYNDTWYPFTVNDTVVGTDYSGEVWDVVCPRGGDVSNFTFQQKDGAWETVEPIIIDGGPFYVFGPWNTTDGTHSLHLRFMYTGPNVEYAADMMTVGSDGSLVGDELMSSPCMKGGGGGLFMFNFNSII